MECVGCDYPAPGRRWRFGLFTCPLIPELKLKTQCDGNQCCHHRSQDLTRSGNHGGSQILCQKFSHCDLCPHYTGQSFQVCKPKAHRARKRNERTRDFLKMTQPTTTIHCIFHYFKKRHTPLCTQNFPSHGWITSFQGLHCHEEHAYPEAPLVPIWLFCLQDVRTWTKSLIHQNPQHLICKMDRTVIRSLQGCGED